MPKITKNQLFNALLNGMIDALSKPPAALPDIDGTPYRPSNGTEGGYFEAEFCDRCAKEYVEKDVFCDLHTSALYYDTHEEGYPKEWIYKDGKPVCTAFQQVPEVDS